jgi:uncharacterized membrane protein YccC
MLALGRVDRRVVEDSARTASAAVVSFLIARLVRMPEAYWATISTIVVMQSNLGAALPISGQRFVGTILGAAAGGWIATYFQANLMMYGAGVFLLGMVCAILRVGSAYRFAGITLTITMLISRGQQPWIVAEDRFIEVSIGIVVALVISALWPTTRSSPFAN